MTGPQLKELRESRNLTQSQLASLLGDCSGATISRWEASNNKVPGWVSEKLLTGSSITLPLEALHLMLNYATAQKIDFAELLSRAIRAYVADPASNQLPESIEPIEPHPFPARPDSD